MNQIKKLVSNSFVKKWFFTLLLFVTILFICFMVYTRIHSVRQLQVEFTSYSELQTERISEHLDDSIQSCRRVGALLSLDEMINIYLFRENAVSVFPDLYTQIRSQLTAYTQGLPVIDSIYLYPASQKEIFLSDYSVPVPSGSFSDTNWISALDGLDDMTYIYRKKNNRYPYLATLLIPIQQSGQKAHIVLNMNLYQLSILEDKNDNSFQNIYIVSEEGDILYRTFQQNMPEDRSAVPNLHHFDGTADYLSYYADTDSPYIYVQQHSSKFPWYYITITTPQSFRVPSYDFFGELLSFLPWLLVLAIILIICLVLMFTHPLRTISTFLDAPIKQMPDNISEPEVQKIIRQFINYVHTNQSLSDELNHQMELQNNATYCALQAQINPHFLFNTLNMIRNMEIESLGYHHEVPNTTLTLSRLLQYAISSTELVPLKTEFYYMDLYLTILNQRYRQALQFEIQTDSHSDDLLMPKMILQPLVENAVFHGCAPALDTCNRIMITARNADSTCTITIRDNGIGIAPDALNELRQSLTNMNEIPSNSIGLQNVAFRMYLTYGKEFHLTIDSTVGEGTCITLSFPA